MSSDTVKNCGLPQANDGSWVFPRTYPMKFMTSSAVSQLLPCYVTYSEFQKAMGRDVEAVTLPDRERVLQVVRGVVPDRRFLVHKWMLDVHRAWRESLTPKFAFASRKTSEQFWWCEVGSAKGWNIKTYILVAVDSTGKLMRYTFYSDGPTGPERRSFCIRFHDAAHREREVSYKSAQPFIRNISKMNRYGDNMLCTENDREEYVQASRNRDGTFYVEYQLYHMPWQMCLMKAAGEQLAMIVRQFCAGGIPAIANRYAWRCCSRPDRMEFDLSQLYMSAIANARGRNRQMILKTVRSLENEGKGLSAPLLVDGTKPEWWNLSIANLPKGCPRRKIVSVEVAAALADSEPSLYSHKVGQRFLRGEGVPRDYALALFWEQRAVRQGSSLAGSEVVLLKNLMDPRRKEKSAVVCKRLLSVIARIRREGEEGIERIGVLNRLDCAEISVGECMSDGLLMRSDAARVSKALHLANVALRGEDYEDYLD